MLLMCCAKGKSICSGVEPSGAIEPPRVIDSTEPSRSVPQGRLGLGSSGLIGSGIGGTIFGLRSGIGSNFRFPKYTSLAAIRPTAKINMPITLFMMLSC